MIYMAQQSEHTIRAFKGKSFLPALTVYDYPMTRLLDELGIPLLLVGDSLGMVVLGYPDTTHVTMEEMPMLFFSDTNPQLSENTMGNRFPPNPKKIASCKRTQLRTHIHKINLLGKN